MIQINVSYKQTIQLIRRMSDLSFYQDCAINYNKEKKQSMSRISKINQRQNYHIDNSNPTIPFVHIFSTNKNNKMIQSLRKELNNKSYPYEDHQDFHQLTVIIPFTKNTIVVISSDDADEFSASIPEKYIWSNDQLGKFYSFPKKLKGLDMPYFQDGKQLVVIMDAKNGGGPKIKLASVHSIKVSKDKKIQSNKSIKKTNTQFEYQKVFYLQDDNQYQNQQQSPYSATIVELQGQAHLHPFKTAKDLQKKQPPKGKKKNLILISTTPKSLKIMNEFKKGSQYFDYLLLGILDPNQKFLQSNVILATNNPIKLVQFFMENGFSSYKMKNMYDRLRKNTGWVNANVENQNNIEAEVSRIENKDKMSTIYYQSQQKLATGEEDQAQKKKIRKIKSPTKGRIPQGEPASQASNANIVISKPKNQIIVQNDLYRVNKQGEKIFKKQSTKEQKQSAQTPNFNTRTIDNFPHPQSKFDSMVPAVESQFLAKRSSGIESKYKKNPSVIIHQMSDQYRGSNKESIMNLQPEKQKTQINEPYQVGPNEPLQQISTKKIVNKNITYANQPQTYYVSSRTTQTIKTNPNLPQPTNNNNYVNNKSNYTYGSINSNYIAASPITVTTVTANRENNGQSNVRTYGYQSPSRVVRKEETTAPEQIIDNSQQKLKQINRITFGSNYYTNNSLNNQISNNPPSSTSNNNNYVSSYSSNINGNNGYGSNRANSPTNYNAGNYNANNAYIQSSNSIGSSSKADIYTSNINNIVSNSSNANVASRNVPTYSANYHNDYYNSPTLNYHSINNQPSSNKIQISTGKAEQIVTSPQKANQVKTYGYSNYTSPPKVEDKAAGNRMASSTLFNSDDYEQIQRDGRIVYRKKVVGDTNKQYTPINYVSGKVQKGQEASPSVRRYELSPVRREQNPYQYVYEQKKKEAPQQSHYQYGKTQTNYTPKKNYEVITIPYKGEDQNLGQMIESSHKKKQSIADQGVNKNFVSVSYRNEEKNNNGIASNYKQYGGVRVYGGNSSNYARVQVQKLQRLQPKVEAKVEGLSPVQKGNALNQSNWFSRMSELHSDGSIFRKNNIRFGIKLQKKQQKMESNISVLDNKMVSGIFKLNDLNKKMALNRIIRGEDYIDQQREKYIHINSKSNRFHFIIQEEMEYLVKIVVDHIANLQDKVDKFAGISSLFSCIKAEPDDQAFDIGLIFAKTEEIPHINAQLIPDHYFIISIEQQQEGLLQINEAQKKIKIDELKHFSLVQKIILDSKLYQYVAYRNNKIQIEQLADKFMNSEFILQKIQTEFTTQILDCYYYELPRLTRLYVLCDEQELPKMLQLIQAYSQINPNFSRQTCKLVCVLSNILDNDELIMNQPGVTFISNPQQIKHYKDILKYAHHSEDPHSRLLPIDNIFYYCKHKSLQQDLAKQYPGRFSTFSFNTVSEVYPKIDKMNKIASRHNYQHKNYLVLHESLNTQKIRVEYFTKIFMLGKAKVIQNKVVRVMNNLELLQLLKK